MGSGMYCCGCLYDLSRTREPRCPECGHAFTPGDGGSTLPTDGWVSWFIYHAMRYVDHRRERTRGVMRAYCRTCYAELTDVLDDRCPVCRTWFDRDDPGTFRPSDHTLARVIDRFRHVCFWRGVLVPLVILAYGSSCLASQTATLPLSQLRYGGGITLTGAAAIAMGGAWMGLAVALHSRYFWGRVEPTWRYAELGTIGGTLAVAIGCGYVLVDLLAGVFA